MDMRHRSTPVQTCQRYVVPVDRVNSAANGAASHPSSACRATTRRTWGQRAGTAVGTCGQLVDPQVPQLLVSCFREAPTAHESSPGDGRTILGPTAKRRWTQAGEGGTESGSAESEADIFRH